MENKNTPGCGYKSGSLPGVCAPLAAAYVPLQISALPAYDADEALRRGTLFPGLDLPFMNMVNSGTFPATPMNELMSLDFAADDLALYLDTHADDSEAFAMYQDILKLAKEARRRYTELFGPVTHMDMENSKSYTWVKNPWPWDYRAKEEG